jgi:asparagine synthase (glutamine-hydrolysing)
MQDMINQTYKILEKVVSACKSEHIALSGGLDSTILAHFLKERKINAITIISKDFVSNDLTFCQMVAKKFNLPLSIKTCEIEEIYNAIEETVKILKNFNDIEIRNNVVMYLVLSEIKKMGFNMVLTGDGADEIFAGYNFLLNKTKEDLASDLKRIAKIMHFPSQKLGQALGVYVESPFCDKEVLEFAKTIPVDLLVRQEGDTKYGKWILRKAFEEKIPKSVAWRKKSPMQDGAGTQGLTGFFDVAIPDSVFMEKIKKIKEKDNVTIRTKESLQYYEIFRKNYDLPSSDTGTRCPDCNYTIEQNTRFCRLCGRFPL